LFDKAHCLTIGKRSGSQSIELPPRLPDLQAALVYWRSPLSFREGNSICLSVGFPMQQRELDPGASVPAFFGADLRRLRKSAGPTQEELGERVNYTGALVGMDASVRSDV
jgi:hypothetical protein